MPSKKGRSRKTAAHKETVHSWIGNSRSHSNSHSKKKAAKQTVTITVKTGKAKPGQKSRNITVFGIRKSAGKTVKLVLVHCR